MAGLMAKGAQGCSLSPAMGQTSIPLSPPTDKITTGSGVETMDLEG